VRVELQLLTVRLAAKHFPVSGNRRGLEHSTEGQTISLKVAHAAASWIRIKCYEAAQLAGQIGGHPDQHLFKTHLRQATMALRGGRTFRSTDFIEL